MSTPDETTPTNEPTPKLTDVVRTLPWVRYLTKAEAKPCTSIRYSSISFKKLHGTEEDRAPYRCKNSARWHFTPLRNSTAREGTYCFPHLLSHCLWDMDENDAMEAFLKRGELKGNRTKKGKQK